MNNQTTLLPLAAFAAVLLLPTTGMAGACCAAPAPSMLTATAPADPSPAAPAATETTAEEAIAFLAGYEQVRAALAADDLAAAQAAAAKVPGGETIARAASLAEARTAFKPLSVRAIALARGREGYFVAHCPMVKGGGGDWVQRDTVISNPYFGSQMLRCGTIRQ